MITRPVTSAAVRRRASSKSAIGPSYSSPWFPPVRSAVGPSPRFTTATGIMIEPHAESSRLYGSRRQPCWTPSRSKSTVGTIGEGRRAPGRLMARPSALGEELPGDVGQGLGAGVRDDDALRDLDPPIGEPQPGHEVEGHPRPELAPVAWPQAHGALAPVRRIAEADGIATAALLLDAEPAEHGEERARDILAGRARPRRVQAGR